MLDPETVMLRFPPHLRIPPARYHNQPASPSCSAQNLSVSKPSISAWSNHTKKHIYANDKGNGQLEKLADELAALAGAPVGSQLVPIEAARGAVSLTRKVVAHTRRRIFIARET